MTPRFAKVSEIAERYRVSADAVYLWIREGKNPADCIVRIAGTVRVDEEQFERQLRSGALYHCRRRRPRNSDHIAGSKESAGFIAEDNFTTVREGLAIEHWWTSETGRVQPDHPFSPEMMRKAR